MSQIGKHVLFHVADELAPDGKDREGNTVHAIVGTVDRLAIIVAEPPLEPGDPRSVHLYVYGESAGDRPGLLAHGPHQRYVTEGVLVGQYSLVKEAV